MNDFRRRLSGGGAEYVFESDETSANTTQYEPNANIYVTSTVNGEYCNFGILSYDGCVSQTDLYNWNSTGKRVWIGTNNTSVEQGIGHVILKQEGSNKTIIITVNVAGIDIVINAECVLLDGNSNSYGKNIIRPFYASGSIYGYGATTITKPDWINISYSKYDADSYDGFNINIYTSSANNTYYDNIRIGDVTVRIGESREFTFKVIQLQSNYNYKSYVTIANTNWGIKNVGASSVESVGNYYQWGAGSTTFQPGVNQYYTGGYSLPASADTATQVLGSGWRMPTAGELQLIINQSHYWTYYNGTSGIVFTDNTNAIFFPPGGEIRNNNAYYNRKSCRIWVSDLKGISTPSSAYILLAYSSGNKYCNLNYSYCSYGIQVRGVHN